MALSDYTELEYIESTGSQFIEIDYIPKTLHTKYELGFMRTGTSGYWNPIINSEEDVRFGIMCTIDDNNSSNYGQFHIGPAGRGNFKSVQFPISSNVKYDIVADKTGISLNGTKYSVSGVGDATGQWSTYINHRKKSSSVYSDEYSLGRWYYLKIYEDDNLIRYYIPTKRKSDNAVGLYDKLNDVFYGNSGSGTFTAGPRLYDIDEFYQLEYIESTGTQYIDTVYYVNANTKIDIVTMCTANNADKDNYTQILGARNSYHSSSALQLAYNTKTNSVVIDYGTGGMSDYPQIPKMKKFNVQIANNNIYIDNVKYQQLGTLTATSIYSLWLFDNNDVGKNENYYTGRVYYLKLYNGNNLVLDMIPVQNKSDNVVGMFDKITGKFFNNLGTGNFIAGPEVFDGSQLQHNLLQIQEELNTQLDNMYIAFPELYRPYIELEYIQSIDKQYIDTNTANILVDGCRIEASLSFASPTERQCIFGTEVASPFYRNYLFKTSSGFECGAYNYNNISYSVEVNQVLAIDYSTVKGNNYLKINNSTIWSNKDNNDRASTSSYLFAFHHRFNYAQAFAKMKLYYFKMYNSNNELIRDFIPVKRKSDNEICMYDKVTNQFFTNQGTGNFIAGPEVN